MPQPKGTKKSPDTHQRRSRTSRYPAVGFVIGRRGRADFDRSYPPLRDADPYASRPAIGEERCFEPQTRHQRQPPDVTDRIVNALDKIAPGSISIDDLGTPTCFAGKRVKWRAVTGFGGRLMTMAPGRGGLGVVEDGLVAACGGRITYAGTTGHVLGPYEAARLALAVRPVPPGAWPDDAHQTAVSRH